MPQKLQTKALTANIICYLSRSLTVSVQRMLKHDYSQHQQCGHHSPRPHMRRLQPVNGPSLCLCSLRAQFDKKAQSNPCPSLPKVTSTLMGNPYSAGSGETRQSKSQRDGFLPFSSSAVFKSFLGGYNDLEIAPRT